MAQWAPDKLIQVYVLHVQSKLLEALLSQSEQYRRTYLTALVAVMTRADSTLPHHLPVPPECLDMLLGNLEDQQGGPEFLSLALCAASLLLSRWPDSRFLCALLLLDLV